MIKNRAEQADFLYKLDDQDFRPFPHQIPHLASASVAIAAIIEAMTRDKPRHFIQALSLKIHAVVICQ
jgi:hypothetical protein